MGSTAPATPAAATTPNTRSGAPSGPAPGPTAPVLGWLGPLAEEDRPAYTPAGMLDHVGRLMAEAAAGNTRSLFAAANFLSLLLFRVGRLDRARALCHAEIDHATGLTGNLRWLALQPQINLMRIEGFAGDLDYALTGLAALEEVAEGRDAEFPALRWQAGTVRPDRVRAARVRQFAANVTVTDTCKFLWRRGLTDRLLHESARLTARWPTLVERGGPLHAAEAAWLVRAAPAPGDRDTRALRTTGPRRTLATIRLLHVAAALADAGEPQPAMALVGELVGQVRELADSCASPATAPRWLAQTGAICLASGEPEQGLRLMESAMATVPRTADAALAKAIAARCPLRIPLDSSGPDRTRLDETVSLMYPLLAGGKP